MMLLSSHVLEKMLPIDANTIFDLIDVVCGSIIFLRSQGNLHNITLPLSFFNNLLRIVKLDLNLKLLNINLAIYTFISSLKLLLEIFVVRPQQLGKSSDFVLMIIKIKLAKGHLLYEGSDLFTLVIHRNAFLSRL